MYYPKELPLILSVTITTETPLTICTDTTTNMTTETPATRKFSS